jgi:hypothetical protein
LLFLQGCEICSAALREEDKVLMFVNRMLRRMFGSQENEEAGGWKKLHTVLHNIPS